MLKYSEFIKELNSTTFINEIQNNTLNYNDIKDTLCVVGESGHGKSTTVKKVLENYNNVDYRYIIPTTSTSGLLYQYSTISGSYVPSTMCKLINNAQSNPNKVYIAVIDECHKQTTLNMINDELLQALSTERNNGNRVISNLYVNKDGNSLYPNLEKDEFGRLKLPDNFGIILISSKLDVIKNNDDLYNRIKNNIIELPHHKTLESNPIKTIQDLKMYKL